MTCEGFVHQPGGCSPVKLLGFTCFVNILADSKIREKSPVTGPRRVGSESEGHPLVLELGPIVVRVLENGPKNLKTFWKCPWLQTLRPIGPEVARTKWTQHLGLWGQRINFFTSYANILPPGQYSFTPRTTNLF